MNKQQAIEKVRQSFQKSCVLVDEKEYPNWIKALMKAQLAATSYAQERLIASRTSLGSNQ